MLLDTVVEEGEGQEASTVMEKVNSKMVEVDINTGNGVMGPPLFPPLRMGSIKANDSRRSSTSSSITSSSDQSIDEFEFQSTLPDGQYTLVSAHYQAQLSIDKSSNKFRGKLASEIQTRSFSKPSKSNNIQLTSKALTKGLQLFPVEFYNANVGTSQLKEVQMPAFESIKNSNKASCDQPAKAATQTYLQVSDSPQSRRHRALKKWWENRNKSQNEKRRGGFCSEACRAERNSAEKGIDESEIRETLVPYVPNKFFEPPSMVSNTQPTMADREHDQTIIRSRLIWEAVQDGLVTLDAILSLPLDWGELCMEHYQNIGVLSQPNQSRCSSSLFQYNFES